MRALTEADVRASFVNADADELRVMEMPHDFVLVEPDTIPRTSSGKIARKASRTAYLDGTLSITPAA